jgi:hypothetical protein
MEAFNEYMLAAREAEALLGLGALQQMNDFGRFLQEEMGTMDKIRGGEGEVGDTMALSARGETARSLLLAGIRQELQVSPQGTGAVQ